MRKTWLLLPVVLVLVPAMAFFGMLSLSIGLASSAHAATAGGDGSGQGAGLVCTPGTGSGAGVTVSYVDSSGTHALALSSAQVSNLAAVVLTGRAMNVPDDGVQIALMVALTESGGRNLANTNVPESMSLPNDGTGHDHDSVGIFQQRPNWGSVQNRMTPSWSASAFFGGPSGPNHGSPAGLLDKPGWQEMPLPQAAQAVQVSAYSDGSNYAKYQAAAGQLIKYLDSDETVSSGGCTGQGTTATGNWTAPNGKTGQDLVDYALQFVGKVPYTANCGASGNPTVGWCCTGFVYYVYNQVLGIQVPGNYVDEQLTNFHQIPQSQAQAGDVIGWGDQHVGIYDGKGGVIHSPDFGRYLTHTSTLFNVDKTITPTFYRANALGNGSW